jgi:hypothetical protein
MGNYVKGPWRWLGVRDDREERYDYAKLVSPNNTCVIGSSEWLTIGGKGDCTANILAAAPDMFEALKKVIEWDDQCNEFHDSLREQLCDAISKAKGVK